MQDQGASNDARASIQPPVSSPYATRASASSRRTSERVFERFYRVDKARSRELGGTGLGLAIVKHLAQSFGGKVGVESEPGKGSTFYGRAAGSLAAALLAASFRGSSVAGPIARRELGLNSFLYFLAVGGLHDVSRRSARDCITSCLFCPG